MTISDGLDDSGASHRLRPTKKSGEDSAITPKTRVKTNLATIGMVVSGVAAVALFYARVEDRFGRITDSADRTDKALEALGYQMQTIHDALLSNGLIGPSGNLHRESPGYAPTVRTPPHANGTP